MLPYLDVPFSQELCARALSFAALAHGEQKTPTGLPYVVHVAAVTMEVMAALRAEPGHDEDLAVACALLHDVLEDTRTTRAELEAEFGAGVAAGVAALTKNPAVAEAATMCDYLDRILCQLSEIAMVELADRTTNLAPPPSQWSKSKIATYRAEAEMILNTLGSASGILAARLRARLERYPGGE